MKEYDSNIQIFAFSNFRKINYLLKSIVIEEKTNGFVDGKSADYIHDALASEENAIDFIQQNEELIYNNLTSTLKENLNCDIGELGVFSISILNQIKDKFAYVGFRFLNLKKEFIGIVMHKEKVTQFIMASDKIDFSKAEI